MTNEQLAEVLYKSLKCKRYLIFMDDLWSLKAWNDIKKSFPDDKNGSQVEFGSLHKSQKPPTLQESFEHG